MSHVVLLGDSIFDNAAYVPGQPPVIEQLRGALPKGWSATLAAIDGSITADVIDQLAKLPADASHLVVSVGGNDALSHAGILFESAATVGDALLIVAEMLKRFQQAYRNMIEAVVKCRKPITLCTVYDSVPDLGVAERTALGGFNDTILRTAVALRLPLIDLRFVCNEARDYSSISPIEPSMVGGEKIARMIAEVVTTHPFERPHSTIYC